MKLPRILGNKRIYFNGKTRTGKSTNARFLLKVKEAEGWWIIIVDPKRDWMKSGDHERRPYGELSKDFHGTVDQPIKIDAFDPRVKVGIIEPTSWDSRLDDMVDAAMAHGYVIFYFDEVRQLAQSNRAPQKFIILYTQGAASNVGAWTGNQRPVGIPEDVKSQAEIWIIFYTPKYEDKVLIASYLPFNDAVRWFKEHDLPYYYFLYYDDQMEGPIILPPIDIENMGGPQHGKRSERAG